MWQVVPLRTSDHRSSGWLSALELPKVCAFCVYAHPRVSAGLVSSKTIPNDINAREGGSLTTGLPFPLCRPWSKMVPNCATPLFHHLTPLNFTTKTSLNFTPLQTLRGPHLGPPWATQIEPKSNPSRLLRPNFS